MAYPGEVPGKRLEKVMAEPIRMDIVHVGGRTLESCKFLGLVPAELLGEEDYNIYVRWDDNGKVHADRSDTDREIVAAHVGKAGKGAALVQLMENLSRFYGRKVTVAVDPGTKVPAAMAKVIGEHDGRPVSVPVTVAEVADAVSVVKANDPVAAFQRSILAHNDYCANQPSASIGDTVYRERDGHTGTIVDFDEQRMPMITFNNGSSTVSTPLETIIGRGYAVIPAAEVIEGQQHTDRVSRDHAAMVKVNRPMSTLLNRRKRKATRRNRARVGGGF